MKKRIICFAVAVMLLIMLTYVKPVCAKESLSIVLDEKEGLRGDVLDIEVRIVNNPGFMYIRAGLRYDDELSLEKINNGGLCTDFTNGTNLLWIADDDITDTGVLVRLRFRISDGASLGRHDVAFDVAECYNYNEDDVTVHITNGAIIVKADETIPTATAPAATSAPSTTPSQSPKPSAEPTFEPTPTDAQEPTVIPTHSDNPNTDPGDVNGDGRVNTIDAVIVLKYGAEMLDLNEAQISSADVNSDHTVNSADAVCILKYTVGIIDRF